MLAIAGDTDDKDGKNNWALETKKVWEPNPDRMLKIMLKAPRLSSNFDWVEILASSKAAP